MKICCSPGPFLNNCLLKVIAGIMFNQQIINKILCLKTSKASTDSGEPLAHGTLGNVVFSCGIYMVSKDLKQEGNSKLLSLLPLFFLIKLN